MTETTETPTETTPYEELKIEWTPRGDRVLVLPLMAANPSLDGLIVLPESTNRERPMQGIVLAVGPGGVGPETGRPVTVTAQIGELVAFGRYAGLDFEVSGPQGQVKILIMRDTEILIARAPGTFELVVHEHNPAKMHEKGFVCDICVPPTVNLDKLRDAAYGELIDAEVGDETLADEIAAANAAVDPEAEAKAKATIQAERDRLAALRNATSTPPTEV